MPRPHDRRRGRPDQAFSTGQAARYCYVTADTIVNWINGGRLEAQRTVGGQYRIRRDDLRAFMNAHGMSTELLDAELGVRPYCWEFHCAGELSPECQRCIAYRSGALNCFELAAWHPSERGRALRCADCEYYARFGAEEDTGRGDRSEQPDD